MNTVNKNSYDIKDIFMFLRSYSLKMKMNQSFDLQYLVRIVDAK